MTSQKRLDSLTAEHDAALNEVMQQLDAKEAQVLHLRADLSKSRDQATMDEVRCAELECELQCVQEALQGMQKQCDLGAESEAKETRLLAELADVDEKLQAVVTQATRREDKLLTQLEHTGCAATLTQEAALKLSALVAAQLTESHSAYTELQAQLDSKESEVLQHLTFHVLG